MKKTHLIRKSRNWANYWTLNLRHMENVNSMWCAAEMQIRTYHSITTVGSSTSTSANDFVYAFLMDSCIAFCKKNQTELKRVTYFICYTYYNKAVRRYFQTRSTTHFKIYNQDIKLLFKFQHSASFLYFLYTYLCIYSLACWVPCGRYRDIVNRSLHTAEQFVTMHT